MKSKSHPTLLVVLALQVLILSGQWTGVGPVTPQVAQAQIADSGAQRSQMIEQLKSINEHLEKLETYFVDGKLQVHVADSDDKKDAH